MGAPGFPTSSWPPSSLPYIPGALWVLGKARFMEWRGEESENAQHLREEAGVGREPLLGPKRVWGHLLGMGRWGEAGKWEERDWGWEGEAGERN